MVIVKETIRTYYNCDENVKLDIDSAIECLSKCGVLSDVEIIVLAVTKEQYSLLAAGELVGVSKSTISRHLDRACKKIANYLGSEYQDKKILRLVEEKLCRKLTEEERKFCWSKIRNFGRNKCTDLNIFNFKTSENGKIVGLREDKE